MGENMLRDSSVIAFMSYSLIISCYVSLAIVSHAMERCQVSRVFKPWSNMLSNTIIKEIKCYYGEV